METILKRAFIPDMIVYLLPTSDVNSRDSCSVDTRVRKVEQILKSPKLQIAFSNDGVKVHTVGRRTSKQR